MGKVDDAIIEQQLTQIVANLLLIMSSKPILMLINHDTGNTCDRITQPWFNAYDIINASGKFRII